MTPSIFQLAEYYFNSSKIASGTILFLVLEAILSQFVQNCQTNSILVLASIQWQFLTKFTAELKKRLTPVFSSTSFRKLNVYEELPPNNITQIIHLHRWYPFIALFVSPENVYPSVQLLAFYHKCRGEKPLVLPKKSKQIKLKETPKTLVY